MARKLERGRRLISPKYEEYLLTYIMKITNERPVRFEGIYYSKSGSGVRYAAMVWPALGDKYLLVNRKNWRKFTEEQRLNLLRHEAIHYRIHGHKGLFREWAKIFNTSVSVTQMFDERIMLLGKKKGERLYKHKIKRFDSVHMAKVYVEAHREELFKKYYRLVIKE